MSIEPETVTLWRPIGLEELDLIEQSDMKASPPRLPEQPIFYPVLTEDYAIKIARDWNVKASDSTFVIRFDVLKSYLDNYDVQETGGRAHLEYWIPAEEMNSFNDAIVGRIEVTKQFPSLLEGRLRPSNSPFEHVAGLPVIGDRSRRGALMPADG